MEKKIKIVIAPTSNDTGRDWPIEKYVELVDILIKRIACEIYIIGTINQRISHLLNFKLFRSVKIRSGLDNWEDTVNLIKNCDIVISNNSGIGHLATKLKKKSIVIFSASHDPIEWGPNGSNTRIVVDQVICSPCGLTASLCPFDKFCLVGITPQYLLEEIMAHLYDNQ